MKKLSLIERAAMATPVEHLFNMALGEMAEGKMGCLIGVFSGLFMSVYKRDPSAFILINNDEYADRRFVFCATLSGKEIDLDIPLDSVCPAHVASAEQAKEVILNEIIEAGLLDNEIK